MLPGAPAGVLAVVALLAFSSAAAAQSPLVGDFVLISLDVDDADSFVEVPYLGSVSIPASVTDLSRDSVQEARGNEQGLGHMVTVSVSVVPYMMDDAAPANGTDANATASNATGELAATNIRGWNAAGGGVFPIRAGQTIPFTVEVKNSGDVTPNYVRVRVTATTRDPYQGIEIVDTQDIIAKLAPFYAGRVLIKAAPQTVGQNEVGSVPVEITNFNTYRDAFLLNVTAPEGWFASIPPRIILEPQETKVVNIDFVTPHDKVYDFGSPGMLFVNMRSENDPKAVYVAATSVIVAGPYFPPYWWPVFVLGVLGAVVATGGARERAVLRRGERNLPRRPRPTPREAALLAELKRRDPEAYKARLATYAAVYDQRRRLWKEHRREELAEERAERRESHRLAKERKAKEAQLRAKQREIERAKAKRDAAAKAEADRAAAARAKAEKREAKLGAKLQKKQAKIDAKRAKVEAKERAKLEAALAKKRRELEAAAKKKSRELERLRRKGA